MSYEIGIKAMKLELAERLAHTEYCSNYALVRAVTGLDPRTDGEAWRKFNDAWQIDMLWVTNDSPVGWGSYLCTIIRLGRRPPLRSLSVTTIWSGRKAPSCIRTSTEGPSSQGIKSSGECCMRRVKSCCIARMALGRSSWTI